GNSAADFTATIDWGDGATTAGRVTGAAGTFTVSGSHVYAEEGNYPVSVTLTDDAPGTAGATATGTARVSEAGLAATAVPFSATIAWGDGTTSAGTVSGGGGSFAVSGSHTYAVAGSFTLTVTLTENAPGSASASAAGIVRVAEVPIDGTGRSLNGFENSGLV